MQSNPFDGGGHVRSMMTWGSSMLLVALAAVTAPAPVAEAVDVQGLWNATFTCTFYADDSPAHRVVARGQSLEITQTGHDLVMRTSFIATVVGL